MGTDTAAAIEQLRRIPLFSKLDEQALRRIAAVAAEFEAPASQVLIEAGQAGSGVFVLEEGTVSVERKGAHIELGPGECFGEMALLSDGAVRAARVKTTSPVRCLAIARRDFVNLLTAEPAIALGLLEVLAERLAHAD